MDVRTGDIYPKTLVDEILSVHPELKEKFLPMTVEPSARQLSRKPKNPFAVGAVGKVGRNEPCSCGSGKKFKKCHFRLEIPC
jgi:uncharacterized protein YecA (UPF0149 family)